MIAGTVYYLATPIRSCMRNRSEAGGDGPCVQSGGRPTCTQKMKSYAGAAWAGVQKAVGQLLSATASELIGGTMPLLGTAISESKYPQTAVAVGTVLVVGTNLVSSLHSSKVVQDAFGVSNRARGAIIVLSCTMPLMEAFALAGTGKDGSASEIPTKIVYIVLGRMLSNACRDFFNEFF